MHFIQPFYTSGMPSLEYFSHNFFLQLKLLPCWHGFQSEEVTEATWYKVRSVGSLLNKWYVLKELRLCGWNEWMHSYGEVANSLLPTCLDPFNTQHYEGSI